MNEQKGRLDPLPEDERIKRAVVGISGARWAVEELVALAVAQGANHLHNEPSPHGRIEAILEIGVISASDDS